MPKSHTDITHQVTEAVEGLRNTSQLVVTLQQGLEERVAQLRELQLEHDRYAELAQIEAKKAEALLNQVQGMLKQDQEKERWIALAMHMGSGILFFVLGVTVGDPFKGFITSLWARFFH